MNPLSPSPPLEVDLERISELAADFVGSQYGVYLMDRLKKLHFQTHNDAENEPTLEGKAIKVIEAKAYHDVIDMIMGAAEIKAGGYFEAQRQAVQDIEEVSGIAP